MDPHDNRRRDLLAAYRRGERMPPDRRAAAWARLQAAIRAEDEPAIRPPPRDRRRDLAWAAALIAVAAALLLLLVDVRRPARDDIPAPATQAALEAPTPRPVESIAPPRRPAAPAPEAIVAPPSAPPPDAPPTSRPRVAPRPRPADVPKDIPTLDAELALLRAAREAIGRGAPADALASLAAHAREFPGGHLREERLLLQAQAECALGRGDAARATAAAFVREFPESPHAPAVAALCAGPG